jgi:hypothetical protein
MLNYGAVVWSKQTIHSENHWDLGVTTHTQGWHFSNLPLPETQGINISHETSSTASRQATTRRR